MRSIEIYNQSWECPRCNRWASLTLKKCRGCGYVYLTDEMEAQAKKERNTKARSEATTSEESYIKSTLKFKGAHND